MTNPTTLLRTLVIYGIVLPVAIILGYLLASPDQWGSFVTIATVLGLMVVPLVLRWYHPLIFLGWNTSAVVFFLPGRPELWLFVAACGFFVAVAQRTLNPQMQLNPVPFVLWPLLYIGGMALVTAQLTGGIGMGSMGGSTAGGRRYIYMFGAIIGYIAMTSHRIPPHRAHFYVGAFYLGALGNLAGDFVHLTGNWLTPLLYVFPMQLGSWTSGGSSVVSRDYGLSIASASVVFYMLARHGIKNLLDPRHVPRLLFVFLCCAGSVAGGFRSVLLILLLSGFFVFWMEGLHRTRYAIIFAAGLILVSVVVLPFAKSLPLPIQRSLSVLPIDVDPVARQNAQATSDWRLQMWRELLPEVPHYLWLGKGLSIDISEFSSVISFQDRGQGGDAESFKMSGDYHNGPLSTIIPFGIWGVIGVLWLWIAGLRALTMNYRNGNPALKTINRFLLAMFMTKMIMFLFVFGGFSGELSIYTSLLGLSVSLNGGVCKPAAAPAPVKNPALEKFNRPRRNLMPGMVR